jgi:hypothetical protein
VLGQLDDSELRFGSMTLKLDDFAPKEGVCDCCGSHGMISPMIRPEVCPISDENLMKMIDDQGEEDAQSYHERSLQRVTTYECDVCRGFSDEKFYIILAVKEDR